MRNGDLSNEVVPRIVLVFEGALGFIHDEDRKKFNRYLSRKHWEEAAALWLINPLMAARIWYLTRHQSMTLDVVTFAGPKEFGEALEVHLQYVEELPVGRVWATRVELLARKIAYMPDLMKIYDPNPERWLTWGGKGQLIANPNELGS